MRRSSVQLTLAILLGLELSGCGLMMTENRMRVLAERAVAAGGGYPDLESNIFSPKAIFTGVLDAERFTRVLGFWIFLRAPHRPGTTPVVFVHGHSTGPRPLEPLIDSLDGERFEPWVCYFATGMPIERSAALFRQSLARAAGRLEVEEVVVLAYSMGGLVARQALRPYDDRLELPRVPLFIGVSNPWGGSEEGRFESERTFAPGSWDDVADGSELLANLYDDPLPAETEFHYIYGLGGEPDEVLGEQNDGILSGDSLARPEALDEASTVTLLDDAEHLPIISDRRAIARVRALLDQVHPPSSR